MRLIDADTFKEYICNAYEQVKHMYPDGGEWARQITEDFCKDIDEQATIDISNNSNTLGALDCIDRQEAIKALCREECGMDPKGCCVGTCYDVEIIEDVPSVQLELSNNSPELDNKNGELISRQKAIDAISKKQDGVFDQDAEIDTAVLYVYSECKAIIKDLPSVQPEPLSDAYMKAVWTWLLNYQIKAAELKGRYTPYEVLSWVANDWRKEHE